MASTSGRRRRGTDRGDDTSASGDLVEPEGVNAGGSAGSTGGAGVVERRAETAPGSGAAGRGQAATESTGDHGELLSAGDQPDPPGPGQELSAGEG